MTDSLPIEAIKADFLAALSTNSTLVLSAPPGAGKSTRLPLWLLEFAPLQGQKIYLLQPRRVAAKNIACFLAEQIGEPVGERIGYRLRNENKVSARTVIEVITEGILTQIIQHDPELTDCGFIILDEFHERSLHGDLAFALARDVQQGLRDDLKLLLMSATLTIEQLLNKLPDAVSLASEGHSFPVTLDYKPAANARFWREHALSVIKNTAINHQGSILVFLPGAGDIRFLAERLAEFLPCDVLLAPLFGELTLKEQRQALAPAKSGHRKLVLATNIAETSLTIEGVDLVIDCGLEKTASYDAQSMTSRLQQQAIAKASAIQRAGRAGRLMPGKCIRLYSEEDFDRRAAHSVSEIQQADLLPLLIESARWGVKSLADLPLIELPLLSKEQQAWLELSALEITDDNRRLTAHGQKVSELACHPRFAHMICRAALLEKKYAGLTALACLLVAFLEERDIYGKQQAQLDCDIRHRVVDLLKSAQAGRNSSGHRYDGKHQRILQQAKKLQSKVAGHSAKISEQVINYTGALLALAYPERIAQKRANSSDYLAQNGKGLSVNNDDAIASETYIVAANVGAYQHKLIIRLAAPVDIALLQQWQLVKTSEHSVLAYDHQQDKIVAEQQIKLGAIVIEKQLLTSKITEQQRAELWSSQVQQQGLNWLNLSADDKALLTRWRWINQYNQLDDFPLADEPNLLANLSQWFSPFVGAINNKKQLNKLNFSDMLLSLLSYQQQQLLSKLAPTHFVGPTGRRCPIRYSNEKSPTVSLPMQELYGQKTTPAIGDVDNNQGIALILELLSPAQRPIQVTQNLVTFWQGSYREVQKDMKARYPKHYWPDDPANAQATNKVKRHIINKS